MILYEKIYLKLIMYLLNSQLSLLDPLYEWIWI